MSRQITVQELSQHNGRSEEPWVAVHGSVYNLKMFANMHPGGKLILLKYSGRDSTSEFDTYHGADVLRKYHKRLLIGSLVPDERMQAIEAKRQMAKAILCKPNAFGDAIPGGDPAWYTRLNSPYYRQSHYDWRNKVRAFVDAKIIPRVDELRKAKVPPSDILLELGAEGFLAAMCGKTKRALKYLPESVQCKIPEDFDYFHEFITIDEISRCGESPIVAGLTNGPAIALSAILSFGSEEQKRTYCPPVLLGQKCMALAISEPNAGSDVAGLLCSAEKTKDGQYYVINGNKKWITNGDYADFFVLAAVTNPEAKSGHHALSLLIVPATADGFDRRLLNLRGHGISGTAYLDFENVRVPVSALIGTEHNGFKQTMYNFNHERFYICCITLRMARVCVEECMKYALNRKAFGKSLSAQQNIQMKIAEMLRLVEGFQAWLESLVYQMCTMSEEEAMVKLGDLTCSLKAQSNYVYEKVALETTHVFGGNALMQGGGGHRVEHALGQSKSYSIPAGARDVMDLFAARSAFKFAKTISKL